MDFEEASSAAAGGSAAVAVAGQEVLIGPAHGAVQQAGVDGADLSEVIMGCVLPAGLGQAPARQASLMANVPPAVGCMTVNKVCGSGLKAVMLASQAIKAGDLQVAVAGGFESMSNVPFYLRNHRGGVKFGDQTLQDGLIFDGLWCSFGDCHMGGHAEYTAMKAGVSREDQDAFAVESHRKAIEAIDSGAFADEIVPVEIKGRKGQVTVVEAVADPTGAGFRLIDVVETGVTPLTVDDGRQ